MVAEPNPRWSRGRRQSCDAPPRDGTSPVGSCPLTCTPMKTLILAAGRFGQDLKKSIGDGRDPRLDIFELARELRADVIDFNDAETRLPWVRRLGKGTLGLSLGVAVLGYKERHNYDAILTTGEDIGLPLAAMLKKSSAKCAHTLIAHTLFPRKKRIFFSRLLNVESRIDRILAS